MLQNRILLSKIFLIDLHCCSDVCVVSHMTEMSYEMKWSKNPLVWLNIRQFFWFWFACICLSLFVSCCISMLEWSLSLGIIIQWFMKFVVWNRSWVVQPTDNAVWYIGRLLGNYSELPEVMLSVCVKHTFTFINAVNSVSR